MRILHSSTTNDENEERRLFGDISRVHYTRHLFDASCLNEAVSLIVCRARLKLIDKRIDLDGRRITMFESAQKRTGENTILFFFLHRVQRTRLKKTLTNYYLPSGSVLLFSYLSKFLQTKNYYLKIN